MSYRRGSDLPAIARKTVPGGLLVSIIPATQAAGIELQATKDDGFGAADAAEAATVAYLPATKPWILLEYPTDGLLRFFRARHVGEGADASAWTDWTDGDYPESFEVGDGDAGDHGEGSATDGRPDVLFSTAGVSAYGLDSSVGGYVGTIPEAAILRGKLGGGVFETETPSAAGQILATSPTTYLPNWTNTVYAGGDASTHISIGGGGAGPTAQREAKLELDVPSSVTYLGSSVVEYQRNHVVIWQAGIDEDAGTGAKGAATDFYWYNPTNGYVAALSATGILQVSALKLLGVEEVLYAGSNETDNTDKSFAFTIPYYDTDEEHVFVFGARSASAQNTRVYVGGPGTGFTGTYNCAETVYILAGDGASPQTSSIYLAMFTDTAIRLGQVLAGSDYIEIDPSTGQLTLRASEADHPALNIPQGVAPTAPSNGDLWTTSAGMFTYIAGVAYQVALLSTTGALTLTDDLLVNKTGIADITIRGTLDAYLYLASNLADGAGEEAGIVMFDSSSLTRVWEVKKDSSDNFVIYDHGGLQTVLEITPSGDMVLSPSSGRVDVAGPLTVGQTGISLYALTEDDLLLAAGVLATGDGSGGTNLDHIWHDDTGNVWHLCSDTTRKANGNSRLRLGAGAADDLAIRVGADDQGIYWIDANSLGVSCQSGRAIVSLRDDNDSPAGRQVRAVVDSTAAYPTFAAVDGISGLYFNVGATPEIVGLAADGHACIEAYDTGAAGNVRMRVWDVSAGALVQVSVGAADSGGTGYKYLRVPN